MPEQPSVLQQIDKDNTQKSPVAFCIDLNTATKESLNFVQEFIRKTRKEEYKIADKINAAFAAAAYAQATTPKEKSSIQLLVYAGAKNASTETSFFLARTPDQDQIREAAERGIEPLRRARILGIQKKWEAFMKAWVI